MHNQSTRQVPEADPEEALDILTTCALLERDNPNLLLKVAQAASGEEPLHLTEDEWQFLNRQRWLRPPRGTEYLRGSFLQDKVQQLLSHSVGFRSGKLVLVCPVPDNHPLFHRIVQVLKIYGAHDRGTLELYPERQ